MTKEAILLFRLENEEYLESISLSKSFKDSNFQFAGYRKDFISSFFLSKVKAPPLG